MTRRIRITIAYDGTDFHGWQVQPGLPTIQGALEEIIGGMEGTPVHVAGSGRTDAGVHARAQVAAFTIENPIPPSNLQRAVNRLLPPAIRILDVIETHPDFHPRFDAIAKVYQYTLFRGPVCSPFEWRYVHHHPYPLDEGTMILRESGARPRQITYPAINVLRTELDAFADAVDNKHAFPVPEADVLATLAAFEAALRSMQSGQPIACAEA